MKEGGREGERGRERESAKKLEHSPSDDPGLAQPGPSNHQCLVTIFSASYLLCNNQDYFSASKSRCHEWMLMCSCSTCSLPFHHLKFQTILFPAPEPLPIHQSGNVFAVLSVITCIQRSELHERRCIFLDNRFDPSLIICRLPGGNNMPNIRTSKGCLAST